MMCKLVVGQKVVCVRGWPAEIRADAASFGVVFPEERKVYTIRAIQYVFGELCVYVEEVVNPIIFYFPDGFAEQGFDPDRFRPLVTRKTDISIFRKMLTPAGRIPVDA